MTTVGCVEWSITGERWDKEEGRRGNVKWGGGR